MSDICQVTKDFLEMIEKFDALWKESNLAVSAIDKEEQQILHNIEYSNFNAFEGYFLAKTIQDVRKRRRDIKRRHYALDSMNNFLSSDLGKQLKKELPRLIRSMKKSLVYTPSFKQIIKENGNEVSVASN